MQIRRYRDNYIYIPFDELDKYVELEGDIIISFRKKDPYSSYVHFKMQLEGESGIED